MFRVFLPSILLVAVIATIGVAQQTSAKTKVNKAVSATLTEDGNLHGYTFQLIKGEETFVSSQISLIKDGEVILKTKSDAEGNFVLTKVAPGDYEIEARSKNLVGKTNLKIAEFNKKATLESMNVPVEVFETAAPAQDVVIGDQAGPIGSETVFAGESFIPMSDGGVSTGGGFGGGGCGIGGCRKLGLLGLVGLVGLAGLAGDDASPDN